MLFAVLRLFLEALAERLTARSASLKTARAFAECADRSGSKLCDNLILRLRQTRLMGRSFLALSSCATNKNQASSIVAGEATSFSLLFACQRTKIATINTTVMKNNVLCKRRFL
jgi:hypothetical protein